MKKKAHHYRSFIAFSLLFAIMSGVECLEPILEHATSQDPILSLLESEKIGMIESSMLLLGPQTMKATTEQAKIVQGSTNEGDGSRAAVLMQVQDASKMKKQEKSGGVSAPIGLIIGVCAGALIVVAFGLVVVVRRWWIKPAWKTEEKKAHRHDSSKSSLTSRTAYSRDQQTKLTKDDFGFTRTKEGGIRATKVSKNGAVIEFENGEKHHYAPASFLRGKFTADGATVMSINELDVGTVLSHTQRGKGKVTEFKLKNKASITQGLAGLKTPVSSITIQDSIQE